MVTPIWELLTSLKNSSSVSPLWAVKVAVPWPPWMVMELSCVNSEPRGVPADSAGDLCPAGGAVQQLLGVEVGLLGDAVDLGDELLDLLLQVLAVRHGVGVVGGLDGQLAHALQNLAGRAERALARLGQRNGIQGIAFGLIEAFDLRDQLLADG